MNDKTQVIDLRLIIKKILEHKLGFILTFTISDLEKTKANITAIRNS